MLGSLGSMMSGGMSWEKSHPARPTRYEPGLNGPSTKLPSSSACTMAAGSVLGDTATAHATGNSPLPVTTRPVIEVAAPWTRLMSRLVWSCDPSAATGVAPDWRGGVDREAPGEVSTRGAVDRLHDKGARGNDHGPAPVTLGVAPVDRAGGGVERGHTDLAEWCAVSGHGAREVVPSCGRRTRSVMCCAGAMLNRATREYSRVSGSSGPAYTPLTIGDVL